jgi:hypothetical protein
MANVKPAAMKRNIFVIKYQNIALDVFGILAS